MKEQSVTMSIYRNSCAYYESLSSRAFLNADVTRTRASSAISRTRSEAGSSSGLVSFVVPGESLASTHRSAAIVRLQSRVNSFTPCKFRG